MRVLFVCLGNICRSPMAEGVFREEARARGLLDRIEIASAGIGGWHAGVQPDARAQKTLRDRGIDISGQRARQVEAADLARFDLVLAMDRENLTALKQLAGGSGDMAGSNMHERIRLFLEFAPDLAASEVPDPYYGGPDGFAHALALIEAASEGLADHISSKLDDMSSSG